MSENNETAVSPWKAGGARVDIPQDAIEVRTYHEYQDFFRRWASGRLRTHLVVIGAAGIGKTETALRAIEAAGVDEFCYLKGKSTQYGAYLSLYEHRNQLAVLDDLDEMLSDTSVTALLKMLLETRNPTLIKWVNARTMKEDSNVPSSFETSTRACLLVNEFRQASKNFGAVLDRSTILWFAPSVDEVVRYVGSWFDTDGHGDVYSHVSARLPLTASPSCRFYYKAQTWKEAGLDWRSMIDRQMRPQDQRVEIILRIEADKSLVTRKAKFERYVQEVRALAAAEGKEPTALSKVSYHAYLNALGIRHGRTNERGKAISAGKKRKSTVSYKKGK